MGHRDDDVICTLHGNGVDSGKLDCSINTSKLDKLTTDEAEELVRVAWDLLAALADGRS